MLRRARSRDRLALVVIATVWALGSCATAPPSSPAQRAADAATAARLQAALAAEPNLFVRDIVL